MKRLTFVFILLSSIGYSQSPSLIDSLRNSQSESNSDSVKLELACQIAELTYNFKIDFWDSLAKKASENNIRKIESYAYNNIGYIYQNSGNTDSSFHYFTRSTKIKEDLKDSVGLIKSYNNLGTVYDTQGKISESIKLYTKSLKLSERLNNISGQAEAWNNLGFSQLSQKDTSLALSYFQKSLNFRKSTNHTEGIATTLNNIGSILRKKSLYDTSLVLFKTSFKLYAEIDDIWGVSMSLNNIGGVYYDLNNLDSALIYYTKASEIQKQMNDEHGLAYSYLNIGRVYFNQDKNVEAKEYLLYSYDISTRIKVPDLIKKCDESLYKIYFLENNWQQAYKHYYSFIQVKDSLTSYKNQKAAIEQQTKYSYEKQKAIDNLTHEKEIAIGKEKQEHQFIVILISIFSAVLILILLLIIYRRLKLTKIQKVIIEETNEELNQTNEELAAQRDEIENQKNKVEQAHDEIKDSINYAKRIQNAILPAAEFIKENLPESFVLYNPKDVVAGDFYWLESVAPTDNKKEETILFAAADCTGHGVPGAMISVVCHNAMNRAVREFGLVEPGLILGKTREIVVEEFEKSEDDVKDGMDIALCSLSGNTLQYAGANNPLWIIRNGEILETKANKQPIGKFENPLPYSTHTIELEKGNCIYIFSDGYADQFGGIKGKKFGYKRLREVLLASQDKSMNEQKEILNTTFNNWIEQGSDEQIDDICFFGVKF